MQQTSFSKGLHFDSVFENLRFQKEKISDFIVLVSWPIGKNVKSMWLQIVDGAFRQPKRFLFYFISSKIDSNFT